MTRKESFSGMLIILSFGMMIGSIVGERVMVVAMAVAIVATTLALYELLIVGSPPPALEDKTVSYQLEDLASNALGDVRYVVSLERYAKVWEAVSTALTEAYRLGRGT